MPEPPTGASVCMSPAETTKRTVPPERLGSPVTELANVYVIGHFGIANARARDWSLLVDGMVGRALRLSLEQLRALPPTDVTAVLECFGNPLEPDLPVRRVANVTWRGVAVRTLLAEAGASTRATMLWATGLDSGSFNGTACGEYLKDLPLSVVAERGIVAYAMNGEPLTSEHGFPARLVVPGYFGTNNVKWLRSITVADRRREHLFTTRLYQRSAPGAAAPTPVRDLDVNSVFSVPSRQPEGRQLLTGWAWSIAEVTEVVLRVGNSWFAAEVAPRPAGAFSWQRFSLVQHLGAGDHPIAVRAVDALGRGQPLQEGRNRVHQLTLRVRRPH